MVQQFSANQVNLKFDLWDLSHHRIDLLAGDTYNQKHHRTISKCFLVQIYVKMIFCRLLKRLRSQYAASFIAESEKFFFSNNFLLLNKLFIGEFLCFACCGSCNSSARWGQGIHVVNSQWIHYSFSIQSINFPWNSILFLDELFALENCTIALSCQLERYHYL